MEGGLNYCCSIVGERDDTRELVTGEQNDIPQITAKIDWIG